MAAGGRVAALAPLPDLEVRRASHQGAGGWWLGQTGCQGPGERLNGLPPRQSSVSHNVGLCRALWSPLAEQPALPWERHATGLFSTLEVLSRISPDSQKQTPCPT